MNTNLVYATSQFAGFVNDNAWMQNNLTPSVSEQTLTKDDVFAIANLCRTNNTPIFADESKFLPTSVVSGGAGAVVVSNDIPVPVSSKVAQQTETQPQTQTINPNPITELSSKLTPNDKMLLEGIVIGIGVMVLFKILA